MINYRIDGEEILFYLSGSENLPFEKWERNIKGPARTQLDAICELVDNGIGIPQNGSVLVHGADLYTRDEDGLLDQSETESLFVVYGLPPIYDWEISLSGKNRLFERTFQFVVSYAKRITSLGPDNFMALRRRSIILVDSNEKPRYSLFPGQCELIRVIEEHNAKDIGVKNFRGNLSTLSEVKKLASACNAHIHKAIGANDVFKPESFELEIDPGEEEDEILLTPKLSGAEEDLNSEFVKAFNRRNDVDDVITAQMDHSRRVRIPIQEDQREQLRILKKTRKISGKDSIDDSPAKR